MFTTPDDRTSIPIDNVQGLEFCRTYTSISVTPIVPLFGAIQSSISELLNVVLLLPGIYFTSIAQTLASFPGHLETRLHILIQSTAGKIETLK